MERQRQIWDAGAWKNSRGFENAMKRSFNILASARVETTGQHLPSNISAISDMV